jgi:hypothetical protein
MSPNIKYDMSWVKDYYQELYNFDTELYKKAFEYEEEYDPEYDDLIIEEYEFSPLLPKGKVL